MPSAVTMLFLMAATAAVAIHPTQNATTCDNQVHNATHSTFVPVHSDLAGTNNTEFTTQTASERARERGRVRHPPLTDRTKNPPRRLNSERSLVDETKASMAASFDTVLEASGARLTEVAGCRVLVGYASISAKAKTGALGGCLGGCLDELGMQHDSHAKTTEVVMLPCPNEDQCNDGRAACKPCAVTGLSWKR